MAVDHRQMARLVPTQAVADVREKGGVGLEAALRCGRTAVGGVESVKASPAGCDPGSGKPRRGRTRATAVQSTVDFQVLTSWSGARRLRASVSETLVATLGSKSSGKTRAKACDQCGTDDGKGVSSKCSLLGGTDVGWEAGCSRAQLARPLLQADLCPSVCVRTRFQQLG